MILSSQHHRTLSLQRNFILRSSSSSSISGSSSRYSNRNSSCCYCSCTKSTHDKQQIQRCLCRLKYFHHTPPPLIGKKRRNIIIYNSIYENIGSFVPKLELLSSISSSTRYYTSSSSSSSSQQQQAYNIPSTNTISVLRNMIKPFLLKCHPDVHNNNNSTSSSSNNKDVQQLNLIAIQNLNSYIDIIQSIYKGKFMNETTTTTNNNNNSNEFMIEIDFIIKVDEPAYVPKKKKSLLQEKQFNYSRRKVQLVVPPNQLCIQLSNHYYYYDTSNENNNRKYNTINEIRMIQQLQIQLHHYTCHEINKLLRIAGLEPTNSSGSSSSSSTFVSNETHPTLDPNIHNHNVYDVLVDDIISSTSEYNSNLDHSSHNRYSTAPNNENIFRRSHHYQRSTTTSRTTYIKKTPYEISRDEYTANLPWHDYQRLYNKAVANNEARSATRGLISKHGGRKRTVIANILSNIRCYQSPSSTTDNDDNELDDNTDQSTEISFVEQLIAFRRLSLLFDEYFDKLQMEEFGYMWENCSIVLTPKRMYNTSKSALYKRQRKLQKNESNNTLHTPEYRNNIITKGYSFTLHSNLSVTITIPIDFYDDELINELDSNVWDFYNYIDTETQDDFFNPRPTLNMLLS